MAALSTASSSQPSASERRPLPCQAANASTSAQPSQAQTQNPTDGRWRSKPEHDDLVALGVFLDEVEFEFAESLGEVAALAFGDDHRGLFLVDRGDEAADEQEEQTGVDHADADLGGRGLEVAEVREGQVGDEQRADEEAARERDLQRGGVIHRVEAIPGGEVDLLDMPDAPMDLLERAEQHQ